jgi:hypothetical protein
LLPGLKANGKNKEKNTGPSVGLKNIDLKPNKARNGVNYQFRAPDPQKIKTA